MGTAPLATAERSGGPTDLAYRFSPAKNTPVVDEVAAGANQKERTGTVDVGERVAQETGHGVPKDGRADCYRDYHHAHAQRKGQELAE